MAEVVEGPRDASHGRVPSCPDRGGSRQLRSGLPPWRRVGFPSAERGLDTNPASRPGAQGAVQVPKVLHLSMSDAVKTVINANLAVGKVEIRTGGEPGTIVAQFPPSGTSAAPGSPVNLFVSTSMYPRGAFEWCPSVPRTLPVGPGLRHEAEQVTLRFARAFLLGDWRTARSLLDSAALPLRKRHWTVAGKPSRLSVGAFSVNGGPLWHTDAARTWRPDPLPSWLTTERRAPAQTSTST
jgi:PASTA domain